VSNTSINTNTNTTEDIVTEDILDSHISLLAKLMKSDIDSALFIDCVNSMTDVTSVTLVDALTASKNSAKEYVNTLNQEYNNKILELNKSNTLTSADRMELSNMQDELKLIQYRANINYTEFEELIDELIVA